jgi:hypothetical protein
VKRLSRLAGLSPAVVLSLVVTACGSTSRIADADTLRQALAAGTGIMRLAPGVIEISASIEVPRGANDLEIIGDPAGTTLAVSSPFEGHAVLVVRSASKITLSGFSIEGNRASAHQGLGLPPSNITFLDFYSNNGVVFEDVQDLTIRDVSFSEIMNYPIIVNAGKGVVIENIHISDSGSLNESGRNNASGGILLENGTANFVVRDSIFENVRGNGVWTHSRYESPRNSDGLIEGNEFRGTARDAIQVGHATRIQVLRNHGSKIGYPAEEVDIEGQGFPVAIDTSGNTDDTIYAENVFEDLNGKCIDLDGFHHGEIRDNRCINKGPLEDYPLGHFGIVMNNANPDMESAEIKITGNVIDGAVYGGLFLIGTGHEVRNNRFLHLNRVGCREGSADARCNYWPDEPVLLRSGIYLGKRAERPADTRDNIIEGNVISGSGMQTTCIAAAPGLSLSDNQIGENECRESE